MKDQDLFLKYINDNYDQITGKFKLLCGQRHQKYDEDIFHESILRCYKCIEKKGYLRDTSPYGIESYLIISYFNIVKEYKRSAQCSKRDMNYNSDNISALYEDYYNSHNLDAREKIVNDLFADYSVLYIMNQVEQNFDNEHFYLFKLKMLIKDMTYKKLQEKTHMKAVRQKVVTVKNWVKENISREDIRDSFFDIFGDIL